MALQYTNSSGRSITRDEWLSLIDKRKSPFYRYPTNPDQQIWRYMDLPKLISLLGDSSLFFLNADVLKDKFEGRFSDLNTRDIERERLYFRDQLSKIPDKVTESALDEFEFQFMNHSDSLAILREWERKWTYISCWHANKRESAAMWRLYSKSDDVIAIQSTFWRLLSCVEPHREPPHGEPILGMVRYFDPDTERVQTGVQPVPLFSQIQVIRA
jgi:hypothetical protein